MNERALRHPGRWLWLLLLIPVALGVARLRFDVEILNLLPPDLTSVQGLKIYQEHFSNARELIVTLKGADADRTTAAAKEIANGLRRLSNLVETVTWEAPWQEHPELGAELIAYLWFNQPPDIFGALTNRLTPGKLDAELADTRDELASSMSPEQIGRLSYDPFRLTRLPETVASAAPSFGPGQEGFGSPDGKFRMVFVRARDSLRGYRECEQWLEQIEPVVHEAAARLGVTANFTGRPAFVKQIAGGMQRDMTGSVTGTAAIIAVLFWLAHRRVKPMLWLLTLLAIILGCTLALGGLVYSAINVVSIGFAAILLGLAVDYAVVHYQEALVHPGLSIGQIRHAIAPSIFWAAVTTISAFLVLNLGGLPGLGQLGTLVGMGVALSALIMIFEYLPPLFPNRKEPRPELAPETADKNGGATVLTRGAAFLATVILGLAGILVLIIAGLPHIDPTADALRPKNSTAYSALAEIQASLGQEREPLWVVTAGDSVAQVASRLGAVQEVLRRAASNHVIRGFTLPAALWPAPAAQESNRATANWLGSQESALREAARRNGFSERAMVLTEKILETWRAAGSTATVYWPDNQLSRWIFERFAVHNGTNLFALGLVTPEPGASAREIDAKLAPDLPRGGVWLSGWELLGAQIFERVRGSLWKLILPMVLLVFVSLWLAFRRPGEILLSIGSLLLAGLCLLVFMRLAHWSWNLLNLMAIPLILGTGVDYSIFTQMALRRYHGNLRVAWRSVGRALLLCGGTAVAAFASLAFSSNAGMASLGQVCAAGIAANMLIAVLLLPHWWKALRRGELRESA